MVARSLQHSGIDFGVNFDADYPLQPYEEKTGCNLVMKQIGALKKHSLFIPKKYQFNKLDIKNYIEYRNIQYDDWGFKFPYLTYVYHYWKKELPDHIVIGMKRAPESLLSHYKINNHYNKIYENRILKVQKIYNDIIDSLKIPVFYFEEILHDGFRRMEDLLGFKIKNMVNYQGVGDGRKYII